MKIDFSDYICLTQNDIIEISDLGIKCFYQNQYHIISFQECAENFKEEHPDSSGNCVGERYANDDPPNIAFYTAPLTTHIHFIGKLPFRKRFAYQMLYDLQKSINKFGYTTYDMS